VLSPAISYLWRGGSKALSTDIQSNLWPAMAGLLCTSECEFLKQRI
jgi:hypothetical protein